MVVGHRLRIGLLCIGYAHTHTHTILYSVCIHEENNSSLGATRLKTKKMKKYKVNALAYKKCAFCSDATW